MNEGIRFIFGVVIILTVIYGVYWITKTVSYTIFYEDMVKSTIRDMVKPEYLIK